jgi:hypothetical protein
MIINLKTERKHTVYGGVNGLWLCVNAEARAVGGRVGVGVVQSVDSEKGNFEKKNKKQ